MKNQQNEFIPKDTHNFPLSYDNLGEFLFLEKNLEKPLIIAEKT